MPDHDDHDDHNYDRRDDMIARLGAAQICVVHCAPWATLPPTDDRRQIWDRLITPYHNDVIREAAGHC